MIDDPVLLNDWHVVAQSSDTGAGEVRPARLSGKTRPLAKANEGLRAWERPLSPSGARLSGGRVQDGCLICPYHGWNYDASGNACGCPRILHSSANACTHYRVSRHGKIWSDLGVPRDTKERSTSLPEWDDASFRKVGAGPYLFRPWPSYNREFFGRRHFPFVHAGFLGDANTQKLADMRSETTLDGIVARDIGVWQTGPGRHRAIG